MQWRRELETTHQHRHTLAIVRARLACSFTCLFTRSVLVSPASEPRPRPRNVAAHWRNYARRVRKLALSCARKKTSVTFFGRQANCAKFSAIGMACRSKACMRTRRNKWNRGRTRSYGQPARGISRSHNSGAGELYLSASAIITWQTFLLQFAPAEAIVKITLKREPLAP